jgi:prolyl oligopeptidase
VKSYDGTLVPLSLVHRRGLALEGHHPTLLMGYGAYGISIDPPIPLLAPQAWLERGGVLAVAHVRGGGECGEDWHRAGMKLTKPNTWRDFLACAEYLIDRKYTSPQYLGGLGASAGGITIGRAITERPELFAAAISLVGCSNPLRGELSPTGPANIPEFGTATTQTGFEDLYRMDSYHQVRDGVSYPAVVLTTGANDPRVPVWEAGKMAARLRAATAAGKPVLLRVEYEGGHASIGSTKTQRHEEAADIMSFLLWQFGAPGFQPSE